MPSLQFKSGQNGYIVVLTRAIDIQTVASLAFLSFSLFCNFNVLKQLGKQKG